MTEEGERTDPPGSPRQPRSGRPLEGRTILVTRSAEQAGDLAGRLRQRGARVIEAPVIAFEDPLDWSAADEALGRLERYDWIVFTSANGVQAFARELGGNPSELTARIAAIGAATREAAERNGFRVSLTLGAKEVRVVFHDVGA